MRWDWYKRLDYFNIFNKWKDYCIQCLMMTEIQRESADIVHYHIIANTPSAERIVDDYGSKDKKYLAKEMVYALWIYRNGN